MAWPGASAVAQVASQGVFECQVTAKFDPNRTYSAEELSRSQFSVRVSRTLDLSIVERCSFSKAVGRVTCDPYKVDQIQEQASPPMVKFYVLRSMFDLQIFGDGTFVENNGRGSIAFGTCRKD
jgi:hypothetical protein